MAEQVRDLGLEYVGIDVDVDALAEVAARGFETHSLNLSGTDRDLSAALNEIVAGRTLAGVLIVDVLEHLVHPERILQAVRTLPTDGGGWSLIVSIPNVTHLDIASKLLLGRWDLTEFGLLDDTHLRFFSEPLVADLFQVTGWREIDSADVLNPISDQHFPVDAPFLRRGSPAHELLRDISERSHSHSDTYQFIRRFLPDPAADTGAHRWPVKRGSDEERVFASVLIRPSDPTGDELDRLLDDLDAQSSDDFETIVLTPDNPVLPARERPDVRIIEVASGEEAWNRGIAEARGRYLCFLESGVRVSRRWIEAFRAPRELAGQVLRAGAASVPARRLKGEPEGDQVVASGNSFEVNPLDILYRPGPTVLSAYAIPLEAARTAGIRFEPEYGAASPAVFLTRAAELCGVAPIADVTVAVDSSTIRDGEDDLAGIAKALDGAPLILPAGSATRIITLRRFRSRVANPVRGVQRLVERLGARFRRGGPVRDGGRASAPSK